MTPQNILNESIWLMVRIVNQLNWQDTLPMQDQYFTNSLKSLLGDGLYSRLLNNPYYISESIRRAYEMYPNAVKHCLHCAHQAWVLTNQYDRICFICGYRSVEDAIGFIDCVLCGAKNEAVFDSLNIEFNDFVRAKCCSCRRFLNVFKCSTCSCISAHPHSCISLE